MLSHTPSADWQSIMRFPEPQLPLQKQPSEEPQFHEFRFFRMVYCQTRQRFIHRYQIGFSCANRLRTKDLRVNRRLQDH